MKKQTIYVEVPISERLPNEGYHRTIGDVQSCYYHEDTKMWGGRHSMLDITHWLEKKEEQIVMSKDEFEKAILDAFEAGQQFEFECENIKQELSKYPNNKIYLSNLLK